MAIAAGDEILASHFTGTRYYSLGFGDFVLQSHTTDWNNNVAGWAYIRSSSATLPITIVAGVHLPHGATITSFKVYWFRDDASASGTANLSRVQVNTGQYTEMAAADSDSSAGSHSVEDTTIGNPVVNNNSYRYIVVVTIDPNDNSLDVNLAGVLITYTVASPLP